MPYINQLPLLNQVSAGDQLPIYTPNNGDARRLPISALLQYFQQTFAAPTVATTFITPGTGFNYAIPAPVSQAQWILIQPAGALATGTVTLPLNTGTPDGTEVTISTTQDITAMTIAINGAAQIYGTITTLEAGAAVTFRYYQASNSWYNLSSGLVGINAAVQAFLATPSSANLAAAVTDETGTGALVFGTGPTIGTATLNSPTINSPTINWIKTGVQLLSGPGAVDIVNNTTAFSSTAAGNALTLADGVVGQLKTIVYVAETAGGDTGVLTPANFGNGTTITFNNLGEAVTLQFLGTDWWVVSLYGAVVA
jgi:hypothetical protein